MIRVRRKGKIRGKSKLILRKEEKEEVVKRGYNRIREQERLRGK